MPYVSPGPPVGGPIHPGILRAILAGTGAVDSSSNLPQPVRDRLL